MARLGTKPRRAKEISAEQRAASAQAAAKLLRRRGPMPIESLLALLGAEGLSVSEALSVVNHGFVHQLLMRDPRDPSGIAAGLASLPAPRRALVKALPPPPAKRAPRRSTALAGP